MPFARQTFFPRALRRGRLTSPPGACGQVLKEETALQDMATRASVMHGKAKVMKADKVVDYLFATGQTSLVSDLMAQNQRLRAAAIAHGACSPPTNAPPARCAAVVVAVHGGSRVEAPVAVHDAARVIHH